MDYLQYYNGNTMEMVKTKSFKPYYKWITFNTMPRFDDKTGAVKVLNLIINGLPSIQEKIKQMI